MAKDLATEKKVWRLVTVHLARGAEELANSILFELGATGTIVFDEDDTTMRVGAYFDDGTDAEVVAQQVEAGFARAGERSSLLGIALSAVPEQDWMQKWKEGFEPVLLGERLLVAPSWKLPADAGGRAVIQIDPGMAFGTGTHETTRLCLQAIETYWRGGTLLDVGTGTGILAIAAARLASDARITAIDIDPLAVEVARENLVINRVEEAIDLREGQPSDYVGRGFDMVVANLTADVIIALIADLAGGLKAAGVILLSGILTTLRDDVEQAAKGAGLVILEHEEAGEWSLVVARKGGP